MGQRTPTFPFQPFQSARITASDRASRQQSRSDGHSLTAAQTMRNSFKVVLFTFALLVSVSCGSQPDDPFAGFPIEPDATAEADATTQHPNNPTLIPSAPSNQAAASPVVQSQPDPTTPEPTNESPAADGRARPTPFPTRASRTGETTGWERDQDDSTSIPGVESAPDTTPATDNPLLIDYAERYKYLLELLNQERANQGVAPLNLSESVAAQRHADHNRRQKPGPSLLRARRPASLRFRPVRPLALQRRPGPPGHEDVATRDGTHRSAPDRTRPPRFPET